MDPLTRHFLAWRVLRNADREIIESIIAPEHRGPSPSLAASLKDWRGAHYWGSPDHSELVLIRPLRPERRERWLLHLALFAATLICSLGAGAALQGRFDPPVGYGPLAWIKAGLQFFVDFTSGSTEQILSGWTFAVPLLGILFIHELGHFVAARRYAVDASPPYFLPVPPTLSPIGSLGAFLRLRSVVVDRRQLLDIGAAGPLAGFVVVLAVLVWGYTTSQPIPSGAGPHGLIVRFAQGYFVVGESLLLRGLREHYFPGVTSIQLSLPAFAGWAGSFITGLNLLPLSQLDGGHVSYGLVGKRQTLIAWLAVLGLLYLSWHTPAWLIWIVLTLLVGSGRWSHPSVLSPDRPVPRSRVVVGWICLIVLVLTFVPVPFSQ